MTGVSHRAAVWLGDRLAGHIWRKPTGGCTFAFDPTYQSDPARPILGARFEDMRRPRHYPTPVPTWFANVLPEGLLRDLVAAQRGAVSGGDDFDLLVAMGEDLPGNVRVTPDATQDAAPTGEAPKHTSRQEQEPGAGLIKFSLAGVQLKFSMYMDSHRHLRLAGHPEDVAVIVKSPDSVHPRACEHEFLVMSWAAASGIHVPDVDLVPVSALLDLPKKLTFASELAYVIRRYDRSATGRIHQEDMCQVLDRLPTPEGKYRGSSYEEVARILSGVAEADTSDQLREFVRRLVFMVACGNGDAHLKNWSLLYPDGIHAELSPAYDLMSTIVYPQYADDKLALPLHGSQRFAGIDLRSFRKVARALQLDEQQVSAWVKDDVEQILSAWNGPIQTLQNDIELPQDFAEKLTVHFKSVPLLAGN